MRCSQCVLTDGMSGVEIGGDGVCNECTASCRPTQPEEIVDPDGYRRMLKRFEGRGDYDCLALVSGGKDSVSMLYELVPVYSMNPLVLTFDYGFDDEQAVGNVWRATQALGTDWIYYQSNEPLAAFDFNRISVDCVRSLRDCRASGRQRYSAVQKQ